MSEKEKRYFNILALSIIIGGIICCYNWIYCSS